MTTGDDKIDRMQESVAELKNSVTEMRVEQKHSGARMERFCSKMDRYATANEDRLKKLEDDLGDRPPDAPNAFAQLQSLMGFKGRATWLGTSAVGLIITVIGGLLVALLSGAL